MQIAAQTVLSVPASDWSSDSASLFLAEDSHFWFRARNCILEEVLRGITSSFPPGYRVLEVGCGNGNVLRIIEQVCDRGTVVGLDVSEERLQFARRRVHCQLIQSDIHRWPFQKPFDLICLFDVLEHLPEDRPVLCQLHQALVPGGCLVLTVPAHPALWSYSDVFARHYRRYGQVGLNEALVDCGYVVEYLTQFMMALFPLMWLRRWFSYPGHLHDEEARARQLFRRELRCVPILNDLLTRLLMREVPLIARRQRLAIGTSLLAIARKPQTAE